MRAHSLSCTLRDECSGSGRRMERASSAIGCQRGEGLVEQAQPAPTDEAVRAMVSLGLYLRGPDATPSSHSAKTQVLG
jgi:hypothetical protein